MEGTGVYILLLLLRHSKEIFQATPECGMVNYTHVMTFDNQLFSRWLLWTKSSMNRNECATFCFLEKTCVSFQMKAGVCRGYAVTFNENSTSVSGPGYMLYVTEKARGFIGSSCQNDADCYVARSVCVNSECMCDPGLAFSPQQKSCVLTCTEYGPHYTTLRGYFIKGHNKATFSGLTEQQCMDRCTTQANFVCVSAEMAFTGACHVAKETLLTVAASDYRIATDATSITHLES